MGEEENDEEEEIFAFKYGADWPSAISDMGSVMLGGRPTNQTLGPVQQMKILIAAAQYRAPTPRRAGKGKPLPPSEYEGEMETDQRKKTQKEAQRLILPKCANESPDMFIRRLDAHKNAPEALIPPLRPPEDETNFIKRCIAVKETTEMPNHLILPKGAKESNAEFEERIAAAKKINTLIFPRGHHEKPDHWKARLQFAKKSKRVILPKSAEEPEKGFHMRVDMAPICEHIVHPFDPEREDEHGFMRRLKACHEKTALVFEPGDTRAIEDAIGPEHVHKDLPVDISEPSAHHVSTKKLMAEALAEEERFHEEEAKAQAAEEERKKKAEAEKNEAAEEAERVAARIAEMKLKQEEARKAAEEKERNASFSMEQISVKSIGFMPLKKLLMERGVPKETVFACANKFQLIEVAKKWGPELKIQFTED